MCLAQIGCSSFQFCPGTQLDSGSQLGGYDWLWWERETKNVFKKVLTFKASPHSFLSHFIVQSKLNDHMGFGHDNDVPSS